MSKFPCRLYITAPAGLPCDELTGLLDVALADNDIAAMLYTPVNNNECADALMGCTIAHDCAFIVADDIALAQTLNADGVHLTGTIDSSKDLYKEARSKLGSDSMIGLSTALNRHDSMCVGEIASTYIYFDTSIPNNHTVVEQHSLENLVSWWSDMFELPCVARAYENIEQNRELITAGVDFLYLNNSLWTSAENAKNTLKSLTHLIAECGRKQ